MSKENRRRLVDQLSLGIRTDKPMDEQDVWLPGVQALEAEVEISPGVEQRHLRRKSDRRPVGRRASLMPERDVVPGVGERA